MNRIAIWCWVALVGLAGSTAHGNPAACFADVDGDGVVGSADLAVLLAAWGTADPRVDFDGDGEVACFDQAFLLGNWGECPPLPEDVNGDTVVDLLDVDLASSNLGLDCTVDLNLDGSVDGDDVDALLCLWETPGPLGDFDGSGLVGVTDLNTLLAAFGAACQCDLDRDGIVASSDIGIIIKGIGK